MSFDRTTVIEYLGENNSIGMKEGLKQNVKGYIACLHRRNVIKLCFIVVCLEIIITMLRQSDIDFILDYKSKRKPPSTTCENLLESGGYNDTTGKWQPYGCKMHDYTVKESRQCLKRRAKKLGKQNMFLLVGDSKVRDHFYAFIYQISGKAMFQKVKSDQHYEDSSISLKLNFIWSKRLNELRAIPYMNVLRNAENSSDTLPDLILNGGALWTIKDNDGIDESIHIYEDDLSSLKPLIEDLGHKTTMIWYLQELLEFKNLPKGNVDLYSRCLPSCSVDELNRITLKTLSNSSVHIWSSAKKVKEEYAAPVRTTDGMHLKHDILEIHMQILMNFICNDYMSLEQGYCCKTYDQAVDFKPFVMLGTVFMLSILLLFLLISLCCRNGQSLNNSSIKADGSHYAKVPLLNGLTLNMENGMDGKTPPYSNK